MSRICALCLLAAVAVIASGCETQEEYKNELKPPAVLTLSTQITNTEIAVSPRSIGAGPTRFVIGNSSDANQLVTVEGERVSRQVKLGPGESTLFKATTYPGPLEIDADHTTADAVEVTVGPERESAQNDLNQP